jgi:hypothetical protein
VAVVLPASSDELRATVRGNAALSRVDVRDGQRTVMRIERAAATGVDVDWPRRVGVRQLALQRPWILVERDEDGGLPVRALLSSQSSGARAPESSSASDPTASGSGNALGLPVAVGHSP